MVLGAQVLSTKQHDRLSWQVLSIVMTIVTQFNGKKAKMWSENVTTANISLLTGYCTIDGRRTATHERGSATRDRAKTDMYVIRFKATFRAGGWLSK